MKKLWYALLTFLIGIGIFKAIHLLTAGQITTNASDRIPWGLDAVAYMYTAGIGAGAYLIGTLGIFGITKFKDVYKIALALSIALVSIAPINLLLAMGRPGEFWRIFFTPNPTSAIVYGAYAITGFVIIAMLTLYFSLRSDLPGKSLSPEQKAGDNRKILILEKIGIPLALVIIGYTGLLLALSRARVLWQTSLMPVIFFISSIISGVAMLIVISRILQKKCDFKIDEVIFQRLGKIILFGILFELLFFSGEIITGVYGRSGEHYEVWSILLKGSFAFNFYCFQIIVGAIIPLYLLWTRHSPGKNVMAAVCVLIGVFAMRYNVIVGGQIVQPSGGPLGQYVPNLDEWLVSIGLWAISGLLFTIAIQKLPLNPTIEDNLGGESQ